MKNLIQAKILLSIIKLSAQGLTSLFEIHKNSHISTVTIEETLTNLVEKNLVKFKGGEIGASSEQRLKLALLAIQHGADLENACRYLGWKEFEDLTIVALELNNFVTHKHFRYKSALRRYEIDVLGFRKPFILSVDCKHWQRSWQRAATKKMVEAQFQRTAVLASFPLKIIKKGRIKDWKNAMLIPVVLTLSEAPFKIYMGVPVVPIFNFHSFLLEMFAYEDELTKFDVKLTT